MGASRSSKMKAPRPGCLKTNCHNRPAFCLNNGVIKLTTLTGGGHIADFRLLGQTVASMNSLWEAPWPTMDPGRFRSSHVRKYGATSMGKFLAAFTGHAVCLDYFGEPSEEEAVRGLALHGEAANSRWKLLGRKQNNAEARLLLGVRLPAAGLRLRRDLSLRRNESVVYVEERLTNERTQDHFFHWIQHVHPWPTVAAPGRERCCFARISGPDLAARLRRTKSHPGQSRVHLAGGSCARRRKNKSRSSFWA